jgi:DNA (cytosine-5)-methyltransferase 1
MRDLPIELWHDSYRRRAYRRVMDGTPTERRGGAPAGIRRLVLDEPCKAITGGALAEFLHPSEDRNLTLRECARIQTFPDDFCFRGTCTEQARLIGNAVPPLLASIIARTLAADLLLTKRPSDPGRLLSFVPTLSNGMSPLLERVTKTVRAAFRAEDFTQKELFPWD